MNYRYGNNNGVDNSQSVPALRDRDRNNRNRSRHRSIMKESHEPTQ